MVLCLGAGTPGGVLKPHGEVEEEGCEPAKVCENSIRKFTLQLLLTGSQRQDPLL